MNKSLTTPTVANKLPWSQVRTIAVRFVVAAAALQLVFFGLLVAGQAVPDKPIVDNLAIAIGNGTYGTSGLPDRMGGTSDAFTECVVAGTGLGSVDKNAFQKAVVMPRIGSCKTGKNQIKTLAVGKQLDPAQVGEYYRYWAGYTIITRPVIASMGLSGMRLVAGGMLALGALLAVWAVGRQAGRWAAVGLLAPLFLATNLMSAPSTSFSQAMSVSIIFLGVAITAWSAGKSLNHAVFGVGLAASLFCYMDLLTTPAIPWAFSTAVVAWITYSKTRKLKATLWAGVLTAGVWILAFAGTWASRWAIAALFVGVRTTYRNVKETVDFRTTGEYKTVDQTFGAATISNWNYWLGHVPTAVLVLFASLIVVVVALSIVSRRSGLATLAVWPLLAVPALIVVIWYEAVSNHSQIHAFFTYRGFPAMLGILMFAALALATLQKQKTADQDDSLVTGRQESENERTVGTHVDSQPAAGLT